MELAERFWAKVDIRGKDECWPWLGSVTRNGYGQISDGSRGVARNYGTHRLAWTFTHGEVPARLLVCHTCDVRHCCNPSHLFLGTARDNMQDATRKGRMATGTRHPWHRSHGIAPYLRISRARGEANWRTKLTAKDAEQIRLRRAQGETCQALADEFGISNSQISRIARRLTGLAT